MRFILLFSLILTGFNPEILKGQSSESGIVTETVNFFHGGCNFRGTLYWPESEGPHPVAVLIPGSGQNDRHGTLQLVGGNAACLYPGLVGSTLRPYRDLAIGLAEAGYGLLTYDELGISCPSFPGPFSFDNLWMPVESALEILRSHDKTNRDRIFLIGHSEGGMLVPYVSLRNNDISAVISLAGPRTPLDSILAYQLVEIAQRCNGDVADAQNQANQILNYFNFVRLGLPGLPDFAGASAAVWRKYLQVSDSVSINFDLLSIPTLMVGMGDDLNVPPSEQERFQNELSNHLIDFYELEGLNHYMTTADVPSVSSQLIDTLIAWLDRSLISSVKDGELVEKNLKLQVFPNPGTSSVFISLPDKHGRLSRLEIHDSMGRPVQYFSNIVMEGEEYILDLSQLSPGMYFLIAHSDQKVYSGRLVVGH
ncbi:MAG: T9SS C-terminal target domain-containing protein [Saprospirales bacterium]|nr:MAG: T9SS C-terminal target domain-containing protein [Saprospirales bacterium]